MTSQTEILNDPTYIPVLNAGFVGLVDSLGDDSSIVRSARVSYGKGTKKVSEDRGLIRYLVRHAHTTPLECVIFTFHMKMPLFVARQAIRHRTASVNEYSGRYSEMSEDMYEPELVNIQPQSSNNKQGRSEGEFNNGETKDTILEIISNKNAYDQDCYQTLLGTGLAKELSRGVLSVNNYTEWYFTIDLHNLFHFLKLRMDAHAQYEIRVFADAMYELIKPIVPIACEAFEDFIFDPVEKTYQNYKLSKPELTILRDMIVESQKYIDGIAEGVNSHGKELKMSQREIDEFLKKFQIEKGAE